MRKRRNPLAPPTTSQEAPFPSVSFRSWKGHGGPEGNPGPSRHLPEYCTAQVPEVYRQTVVKSDNRMGCLCRQEVATGKMP